ncbi:transposase [Bradyrhizobium sp. CCBAU 11430]|uniref:transposase n=1 Tax=Bradyrhizobium sp. CCBAU 11430 TaxID=1630881 RepID=UPI003FA44179
MKHGRFFYSKAKDCTRCLLKGDCLSKGRVNKASFSVTIIRHCCAPAAVASDGVSRIDISINAIAGAQRASTAKTWHGLARAVPRGLPNMKIQAYLTAAAINLKRLATALLVLILSWIVPQNAFAASDRP